MEALAMLVKCRSAPASSSASRATGSDPGNTCAGKTFAGLASTTRGHAVATYTVGPQLNGTLWRIIDTIGLRTRATFEKSRGYSCI